MAKLHELGRRILAWCKSHKLLFALIVAACVVIVPNVTFAESGDLWTKFATNPIDATALILAGLIQNITALLGKITLLLIEVIVVPILGYNGFYNSNITNLGWSLVRDVVNMFVVVILLVIAVMTIVGYSKANWTQQLPRLFIAIVLVNFSKLICGVFIDLSQVVMFTFVNAIVSIAAGNFAAMLGLNTFGQFNADFLDDINSKGSGFEAFMYLGAAYFNFVIYLAILGVMFLLAIAFIWRIIVLWILIIMSPLAFFMIGIKDIFHTADGVFNNWKGKFVSALTFGPVLTFFLWLALAASSGSTLAKTEDFPMPDEPTQLGLPLEMFSLDNFLGMLIALAILIAGMQQASSMAQGMGGFASAVISDKMGMGLAKGLARPFNSAKRLGKGALTGAKIGDTQVPGLANLAPGYTQKFGKGLANAGTALSKKMGGGVLARAVGGTLAGAGAFAVGAGKDERKARNKAGAEAAEHMTDEQKAAYNQARADVASGDAERVKRGQGVLAQYGSNELHGARMKELLTKEKAQKAFKKDAEDRYKAEFKAQGLSGAALDTAVSNAVKSDFDNVMKQHIAMSQTDEGKAFMQLTSEEKDSIEDTMTANPHLIEPKKGIAAYQNPDGTWRDEAGYKSDKQKAIQDHLQAMEDKKRLNVGAISAGSFTDPVARAALEGFVREGKDGKKTSLWSEMESGKGTIAQRKAIISLITAEQVRGDDGSKHVASLVRASAVGNTDTDGGARKEAVRERIASTLPSKYGPTVYGRAAAALLEGDIDKNGVETRVDQTSVLGSTFATLNTDVGSETEQYQRADAVVQADAKSVRHLDSLIGEDANAASEIATSRVNLDQIRKLRVTASENSDDGVRAAMALKTMERAVNAEMGRADNTNDRSKTLKRMADELGTGRRYTDRRRTPPPTGGDDNDGGGGGGGGDSGGDDDPPPPSGGGGGGGGTTVIPVITRPATSGGSSSGGGGTTGGGTPPPAGPAPTTPSGGAPLPSVRSSTTRTPGTPAAPAAPAASATTPTRKPVDLSGGLPPRTDTSTSDSSSASSAEPAVVKNRYGTDPKPPSEGGA